ncbi:MAG: homocysteine S-methyltransferase family protein, partial [Anaerovorax sp.]
MSIIDLMKKKILVADGAMGTMLQKEELVMGSIPELLSFSHPQVIKDIYKQYFHAGSDFVCTNTFGANGIKLKDGPYSVAEVVGQGVKIAKEAAEEAFLLQSKEGVAASEVFKKYVALDVAPLGRLLEPVGDMTFDEACDLFKEQIEAGAQAGADLILLETFTDIYEMKAAVIAAKETCGLPVFCSVTFQENGRMLMGTDPLTMVNILQDLNIDALGVNCSLGPKQMIPIVSEILKYARIPVLVQPNAGMPKVVNGVTTYDVTAVEYTEAMMEMVKMGVSVVGGCCGTTPDFIGMMTEELKRISPIGDLKSAGGFHEGTKDWIPFHQQQMAKVAPMTAVSSSSKTVILDERIRPIGERINPTGKKNLKEALRENRLEYIESEALNQVNAGAEILDINVGLPEIDETQMMIHVVKRVSSLVATPLQIDSANAQVVEAAVRIYNGKPLINSVNGKQEVMDAIFPIVKKYGACVIALTLDEKGLPENTAERVAIAGKIINEAKKYGIESHRIIVDCLTLTVSAQQNAGRDTLEAIRQIKEKFGVKTTLGASNISFGLPQRKLLNGTFLAMALEAGLDAPITDPTVEEYMDTIRAFEALSGKDVESQDYIRIEGAKDSGGAFKGKADGKVLGIKKDMGRKEEMDGLDEIIQRGQTEKAAAVTEELLKTKEPLEIVETMIIPALEKVGKEYETGETYLPQLMKSADTVSQAFVVLKAAMKKSGERMSYGKIVMATVEGDIHDIGKNIVKVLLENYGYEVIDLGKDVKIERVVAEAKKHGVKMVGLSALMTTTVANMEKTILALRDDGNHC